MPLAGCVRWTLGGAVAALLLLGPFFYYRADYAHAKRLREVVPGRLYRSGQLTAAGFADAVARLHLRTIINLQDEFPDPLIQAGYWGGGEEPESDLCRRLGVRYVYLPPDLISRRRVPEDRPKAIDEFLALMDDPANYPVLIHCKAGLHRTGSLTAVYRMEYQGWSPQTALRELRANGFGHFASTADNDYITQYILSYRPGLRRQLAGPEVGGQKSAVGSQRSEVRGQRSENRGLLTSDF